jgi:tricorn protease-like protein
MQFNNFSQYDVVQDGTLVYLRDALLRERKLVSVDRTGTVNAITSERRPYGVPRLSRDGKRLALSLYEGMCARHIRLYEMCRDSLTTFTFEKGLTSAPARTPDGRNLALPARLS